MKTCFTSTARSTLSHGYGVSARWVGTHALEAVGTGDGRVEGRVTYQVSLDGRTLTLLANERKLELTRV